MSAFKLIKKKIGELLIERKIITSQELEVALKAQEVRGGYIGQHLIRLGFATEFDIIHCLSNQYGFPYLPLNNYNIPNDVLEFLPLKLMKIYSVVPIDKSGSVLTVSMADPLNEGVIDILKNITDCEIEVFISTYSDINLTLKKYFGDRLQEVESDSLDRGENKKEDIIQPFVQISNYAINERRSHIRYDVALEMSYIFEDKSFNAEVQNMSCIGLYFLSNQFIQVDTSITTKIDLGRFSSNPVVKIVRVEPIGETVKTDSSDHSLWRYGIAGYFNFTTEEDKRKIVLFIEENCKKNI